MLSQSWYKSKSIGQREIVWLTWCSKPKFNSHASKMDEKAGLRQFTWCCWTNKSTFCCHITQVVSYWIELYDSEMALWVHDSHIRLKDADRSLPLVRLRPADSYCLKYIVVIGTSCIKCKRIFLDQRYVLSIWASYKLVRLLVSIESLRRRWIRILFWLPSPDDDLKCELVR